MHRAILISWSVVFFIATMTAAQGFYRLNTPRCSSPFTPVGDSCLFVSMTESLTFDQAREYCKRHGGDLAEFHDANQYAAALTFIGRVNPLKREINLWVGGQDATVEGLWQWVGTGTMMPSGAPFWGSQDNYKPEPSGGSDENCAALLQVDRYYMHDQTCNSIFSPVCQKMPASELMSSQHHPIYNIHLNV